VHALAGEVEVLHTGHILPVLQLELAAYTTAIIIWNSVVDPVDPDFHPDSALEDETVNEIKYFTFFK